MYSIQGLIDYVKRFDPDFLSKISGATEEEIQTLEGLVGRSLPDAYKMFLSHMGHTTGSLHLSFEGTTNITHIIDYYRCCLEENDCEFPGIIIATGGITDDICLQYSPVDDPPVFFSEGDDIKGVCARSLSQLLFKNAFKFQLYTLPIIGYYTTSYANLGFRNRMAEARQLALQSGFQEQWFSDCIKFCGISENLMIAISQFERQGMALAISGQSEKEVSVIGEKISKLLELKFQKYEYSACK